MMKRLLLITMMICVIGIPAVTAEGTGFVLDSFDINSDVLSGMFPTYLTSGSRFSLPSLIDGNNTDLLFITGGGYTQRQVWRDASGAVLDGYTDAADAASIDNMDLRKFNAITGEWKLLFNQGIFWNDATDDDLMTLEVGYKGRFERYQENVGDLTGSTYFFDPASTVYTESEHELLSNTLTAGFTLDAVVSDMVTASGVGVEISADYAPLWMLNELLDTGKGVDYYSVYANIEGYLPLMQILTKDESKNLFAMYVADRIRVDYIDGDAVPVYAQKYPSLGYKMRGFEDYSYATSLNAVNNLDLRLTGPELISGLFPRLNVFCDVGYYMGHYLNDLLNTDEGLLISAGGEFAISVFDFLNAGIRANYVFSGDPLTQSPFSTDIFTALKF